MSLEETLDVVFDTECDFCNKELYTGRRMIYFQCIDCNQPTKICLDCFVSGMTYGNHRSDHRVRIRGIMTSASWSKYWTSDDDIVFLSILLQTHRIDFAAQAVGFTTTLARAHINYIACEGDLYNVISKYRCPLTYVPDLYFLRGPTVGSNDRLQPLRKRFIRIPVEKIRPFEFKAFSSLIEVPRYVGAPRRVRSGGLYVTRIIPGDYTSGYFPMRLDLTTPPLGWADIAIVGIQSLSPSFTKCPERTCFNGNIPQPYAALRYISVSYKERFLRKAILILLGFGVSNFGHPFTSGQSQQDRDMRERDRDKELVDINWTGSSGVEVDGRRLPIQLHYSAFTSKFVFSWATPSYIHPGFPPNEQGRSSHSFYHRGHARKNQNVTQHSSLCYTPSHLWSGCAEYKDIINKMLETERKHKRKMLRNLKVGYFNQNTNMTPPTIKEIVQIRRNLPRLTFYNYTNLKESKNIGFSTNQLATPSSLYSSPGIMLCAASWLIEYFGIFKSAYGLSTILRERTTSLLHSSLGRTCVRCGLSPSSMAKLLSSHALENMLIITRNTLRQIDSLMLSFIHKQQQQHFTSVASLREELESSGNILKYFSPAIFKINDSNEKNNGNGVVGDLVVRSYTRPAEEALETGSCTECSSELISIIDNVYKYRAPGLLDIFSDEQLSFYKNIIEERERIPTLNRQFTDNKNMEGLDFSNSQQKINAINSPTAMGNNNGGLGKKKEYSSVSCLGSQINSDCIGDYSPPIVPHPVSRVKSLNVGKGKQHTITGTQGDQISQQLSQNQEILQQNISGISKSASSFSCQLSAYIGLQFKTANRQQSLQALAANPVFTFVPKYSPILVLIFSLFGMYTETISETPSEIRNLCEKFANTEMAKRVIYGIMDGINSKSGVHKTPSTQFFPKRNTDSARSPIVRDNINNLKNTDKTNASEVGITIREKFNELLPLHLVRYKKIISSKTYYAEILKSLISQGSDNIRDFILMKKEFKNNPTLIKEYGTLARLPKTDVFFLNSEYVKALVDNYAPGIDDELMQLLFGQKIILDEDYIEGKCMRGIKNLLFVKNPKFIPLPEVLLLLFSGLKFDTFLRLREKIVSEIVLKWPKEFLLTPPKVPGERKKSKPRLKKIDGYGNQEGGGKVIKEREPLDIIESAKMQLERFISVSGSYLKESNQFPGIPVTKYYRSFPGIGEVLSLIIRMELDCRLIKATSFLDYEGMFANSKKADNMTDSYNENVNCSNSVELTNVDKNLEEEEQKVTSEETVLSTSASNFIIDIPSTQESPNDGNNCRKVEEKNQKNLESDFVEPQYIDTKSDGKLDGNNDDGSSLTFSSKHSPIISGFYKINNSSKFIESGLITENDGLNKFGDSIESTNSTPKDNITVKRKISSKLIDSGLLNTTDSPRIGELIVSVGKNGKDTVPSIFNIVSSLDLLSIKAPLIICDFSKSSHENTIIKKSKFIKEAEGRIYSCFGEEGVQTYRLFTDNRSNYGIIQNKYNPDSITTRLILDESDPLYDDLALDNGIKMMTKERFSQIKPPIKKYQGADYKIYSKNSENYEDFHNSNTSTHQQRKSSNFQNAQVKFNFTRQSKDRNLQKSSDPYSTINEQGDASNRERKNKKKEHIIKISCSGLSVYYQHLMIFNPQTTSKNKYVSEYNEDIRSRDIHRSNEISEMFSTLTPDLRRLFRKGVNRL